MGTKKKSPEQPITDELPLGVNVASGAPGVVPTAFLAIVEAVDADGQVRYQLVQSDGMTPFRASALTAQFEAEISRVH